VTARLPAPLWALVQRLVPVACVDLLPVRGTDVGLIRRPSTDGPELRWALVGGRVRRGETIERAAARHLRETLGPDVRWAPFDVARPRTVGEYFPDPPPGGLRDARQHAIALTYVVGIEGEVRPGGEAVGFAWFGPGDVPAPAEMVPGHDAVLARLLPTVGGDA
jgi:ADP-ribose pyrophosphatase YjhB (NUDIX family)